MTTETTTVEPTVAEKALAASGATVADLSPSAVAASAPKAPAAPSNEPPKSERTDDEVNSVVLADPVAEAAAKAASDKAAAEAVEAAGPLKDYAVITDSPAAAAAIDLLKAAGVGPNAADAFFAKAIQSGDLADIDVAGLEAKLGKPQATLVMAGVKAHFDQEKAKGEATVKLTHGIFGGEENWTTVRAWAQKAEKTSPQVKAQIDDVRSLLNEGGHRAEAGARELLRLYNAAPDNKGLGTTKLAVSTSTGTVIGTPLSRTDYVTELNAAHARRAKPAEIQALDARRRAGMKANI